MQIGEIKLIKPIQKYKKFALPMQIWKKTCQIDARNIKNLHCQRKNFKNLTCQCKKYKKFTLPMQIGEKTRQINAKNIKIQGKNIILSKENPALKLFYSSFSPPKKTTKKLKKVMPMPSRLILARGRFSGY